MAKELKSIITSAMERELAGVDGCVLIDFAGLNSELTVDLRNSLRKDGIRMRVVHNRLAGRALSQRETPFPQEFVDLLRGPTALLVGEGGVLVASKSISNWLKKNRDRARIKGGVFEGKVLTVDQVQEIAAIPDRATLLAQTAAMFLAPLQFLPSAARSLVSHFAGCVQARHDELSSQE